MWRRKEKIEESAKLFKGVFCIVFYFCHLAPDASFYFFADALGALIKAVGGDFFLFGELADGAASLGAEQNEGTVFLRKVLKALDYHGFCFFEEGFWFLQVFFCGARQCNFQASQYI